MPLGPFLFKKPLTLPFRFFHIVLLRCELPGAPHARFACGLWGSPRRQPLCYPRSMPEAIPIVNFEKPALPTLWLDTSVVIKLTKIERGEALQEIEVKRGTRLQKLVHELVEAGKLLCPESDQEEEYVAQRLDDAVHRMFASLSLGVSLTHRQGIMDEHVFKGMRAYASDSPTIELPSSTYFYGDPIRRLQEARKARFIITAGPFKSAEMVERRAEAKAEISRKWEELRLELVAEGQTYEKQLEAEKRGYMDAILELVRKFEWNLIQGKHSFWDYMGALGPLLYRRYWHELGGQPPGWEGVHRFFCSPYFSELPLPYINCRLGAELLTGNEPIAPGDAMDVDLLSVALPVAHYILADRRMEQRIRKLRLDEKCSAEVYSMSTIDGLFDRLEQLR